MWTKRKPHLLLLHTFHRNYPIQAFQLSQQQQQQQLHASPPYIPNISSPYIQPQYPQHSELDQLDYLLGVPSGTASVIDVHAATDSNILEEIVAATDPVLDHDDHLKMEEAFDQMQMSARSSDSGNSEDHLYQILNIPKAQEAEDLMNIPTNTLLDPSSPERMVDIQQEQHDSEEEPEDLMNIPTSTLLDANSPERLEDIHHQEQHDSEDDQQTELNTPVIIPDLETLFPRAPPQVVRSQQNVFLPLRGLIQTDSTTKTKNLQRRRLPSVHCLVHLKMVCEPCTKQIKNCPKNSCSIQN